MDFFATSNLTLAVKQVKVGWGLACLLALSAGLFFFYLKKNRGMFSI